MALTVMQRPYNVSQAAGLHNALSQSRWPGNLRHKLSQHRLISIRKKITRSPYSFRSNFRRFLDVHSDKVFTHSHSSECASRACVCEGVRPSPTGTTFHRPLDTTRSLRDWMVTNTSFHRFYACPRATLSRTTKSQNKLYSIGIYRATNPNAPLSATAMGHTRRYPVLPY